MIQVKGTLTDAGGNPASHAHILFKTSKGFGSVLPSAELTVITDSQGGYDFTLSVGIHLIYVRYGDGFELIGKTVINSDTPSPLTVSDLLNQTQPLLPEEIAQVATMLAEVRAIYQSAKVLEETILTSAEQVSTDAQQVMQSKKIVSDLAAQVALDSSAVAEGVSSVSQSKEQVTALAQDVSTKAQQVAEHSQQVTDDKARVEMLSQQVEQDAAQSSNAAEQALSLQELAKRWAVGINPPSEADTPTDENNARHWAKLAQYNANQTFISGGYFSPSSEGEYPDVLGLVRDTVWLIKFATADGAYTYQGGPLAGVTVKNGYMLVFDTPANVFDYIPTVFSGIVSVNSKLPDEKNELQLTADDFPDIYSADQVDTKLAAKADMSSVYAKTELDPLLALKADKSSVVMITSSTGGALLPAGPTEDRPETSELPENVRVLRFNTTTNEWEGLDKSGNPIPIGGGGVPPFTGVNNTFTVEKKKAYTVLMSDAVSKVANVTQGMANEDWFAVSTVRWARGVAGVTLTIDFGDEFLSNGTEDFSEFVIDRPCVLYFEKVNGKWTIVDGVGIDGGYNSLETRLDGLEKVYVVDQGMSGDKRYRKWSDGTLENWANVRFGTGAINTLLPTATTLWLEPFVTAPTNAVFSVVSQRGGGSQVETGEIMSNGVYGSHTATMAVLQCYAYKYAISEPVEFSVYATGSWK
ncbi:hypothetical protein ACPD0N_003198 [Vibrio cholerae]